MSTISVTNVDGETKDVEYQQGWSLMEVLREAGYDEILAMCGGSCSCATCHVHIVDTDQSGLPPIEEDEEMLVMTTDVFNAEKSRLSCQIPMTDELAGLQVQLVPID